MAPYAIASLLLHPYRFCSKFAGILHTSNKSARNIFLRKISLANSIISKIEMLQLENNSSGEEEEEELPPIMVLPREVRGGIYSKLPQEERVKLRLVCKQWRTEVDELCTFAVGVDDTRNSWDRVFQLRLDSCEIKHFIKPPPNGRGTKCLKFPTLLHTLKILTDSISPQNFYYLLTDCAPSVVELYLRLNYPLLGESFPSSIANFDFGRLRSFELTASTLPKSDTIPPTPVFPLPKDADSEILFSQFLGNLMPGLRHLKIELNVLNRKQVSEMSGTVLQFLSNHWKTLVSFDFELMQGHGLPTAEYIPMNDSDLEKIDFKALGKSIGFKSLRIVSSSAVGVNLWIDLILNQIQLKYVEVDILPVPSCVFRDMVTRNVSTLTICEITDLTVWTPDGEIEPFDVSVFQGCKNLKKLVLDRNVISRRRYDCAELINLYNLPSNLSELALNYLNVLSEDFVLLFEAECGLNLQNLTLNQCGNSGPFGINGTVMEKIINLPFIIFIEISPLNFTDPAECTKLNGILLAHGYTEGHSYFQLSRLAALVHFGNLLRLSSDSD